MDTSLKPKDLRDTNLNHIRCNRQKSKALIPNEKKSKDIKPKGQ